MLLALTLPANWNVDAAEFNGVVKLPDGINLQMVKIKAGTFDMGVPENTLGQLGQDKNSKPLPPKSRRVSVTIKEGITDKEILELKSKEEITDKEILELKSHPLPAGLHRVTLTKDYWLGEYEVTQAQWKSVMRACNPNFKLGSLPEDFLKKYTKVIIETTEDSYMYVVKNVKKYIEVNEREKK